MNKRCYRIIINRARGLKMAVAEKVKLKNSINQPLVLSASVTTLEALSLDASLKPLNFPILLVLGAVAMLPSIALADIIADHHAPANQQPSVVATASGIPQVNIQTPSAAGVSRNTYSQFDVNTQGVILNNSSTNVQTQLGGYIQGNPSLANGTARVILNEVNSSNPSLLNGYVEVGGSRAQVVIANPAGISCDGCGFINANRATLTTGTPIINGGNLLGYVVGGGQVNFLGQGLDARQTNYTDVIARAVAVNAGIYAQNLNIITGANQVQIDANGNQVSTTPTVPNGSSPAFAIDVAALGGMYAGKIHLIGTEAGVGMRNAGTLGASIGEISITADGQLINAGKIASSTQTNINVQSVTNTNGTITATQFIGVAAASLTGDGKILSEGDLAIHLTADYIHTGQLQANGNAALTTTGNMTNQGKLLAGNSLNLIASNIDNAATGEISALNTTINATNALTNRGLIDGSNTFIQAASLNNIGTGSIFGDHLAIQATTLINDTETVNGITTAATIAARNRLDVGANSITNREHALIFSAGDMAIGGSLDANHQATGQAATLNNNSATIEALGSLNLNVAQINNTNDHFSTEYVTVSQSTTPAVSVDVRYLTYAPPPAVGNTRRFQFSLPSTDGALPTGPLYNYDQVHFYVDGGGFTHMVLNDGSLDAPYFLQYDNGTIVNQTRIVTSAPAQILAGSNMQITANNLLNDNSKIIAGGALSANVATLNNNETFGTRQTQQTGASAFYRTRQSAAQSRDFVYPIVAAPVTESFSLGSSSYTGNMTPAGTGAAIAARLTPLPNNSLFHTNPNPAAGYLIETNPRFANYRTWLSSDFMLQQLNIDPATSQKRLGDGFYEQRLIREQVAQLTGRRFVEGYASDEAEYQALMQAGVTYAKQWQLVPGIALTPAQIAQLTSDLVWLVEQTVTLPDGTTTQALVPKVYFAVKDGDLSPSGSLITADNLQLNATGDVTNVGTIAGRNIVNITADNINNLDGQISGARVDLAARQDINNLGGTVKADDSLILAAGQDINNISTTKSSHVEGELKAGDRMLTTQASRTNVDRVAGLYVNQVNGQLLAAANRNIINLGSVIDSAGNANLQAQNVVIASVGTTSQFSTQSRRSRTNGSEVEQVGSNIRTGGSLSVQTGQAVLISASKLDSGKDIQIQANNITLQSAENTQNFNEHYKDSRKKINVEQSGTQQIGSTLSAGGNVQLIANQDVTLSVSKIQVGETASVIAGNQVDLLSANNNDHSLYESSKKGDFGSKSHRRDETTHVDAIGSSITSGKDLQIISGGDQSYAGAKLTSGGDLVLKTSGEIRFNAVKDVFQQAHEKSSSNLAWQSARGKGNTDETLRQSELVAQGQIAIDTAKSIHIDIKQVDQQTVSQTIDAMVQADLKLGWLKEMDKKGTIDWHQVKELHDSWKYSQSGLGAGASLAVTIVVAAMSGGTGAGLIGAEAGTATAAAANAAFISVASKAAISTINNQGDLGAILGDVLSPGSLKSYVTAVAAAGFTAGVIDPNLGGQTNSNAIYNPITHGFDLNTASGIAGFTEHAAAQALASATINTAINGGSFGDNLSNSLNNAAINVAGAILYNQVGNWAKTNNLADGSPEKVALHALVGGLLSKASGGDFATGAVAAGANEALSNQLAKLVNNNPALESMAAQLVGIATTALTGGNPASAAQIAQLADTYNRQLHQTEYDRAKKYRDQAAKWLSEKEGRTVTPEEAEARIVRQMERGVDYATAKQDGFRVDESVVSFMGSQLPKQDQYYYDTTYNSQYIQANLSAYNAALAQSNTGLTPQQINDRNNAAGATVAKNIALAFGTAVTADALPVLAAMGKDALNACMANVVLCLNQAGIVAGEVAAGNALPTGVGANTSELAATRASVDDKLARYLLNPDHPIGGSKAQWFESALGFNQGNADQLAKQIIFNEASAVQTGVIEQGVKFNQVIPITGANGKVIDVTFGWVRNNDGIVRLTTGIPTKK